jgi:hypothetical protein
MRPEGLNIVFSGMVAADPHQGGASWSVLQYVLGLEQLGHRVALIEPVALAKLVPAGTALSRSTNAAYFERAAAAFGLSGSAALLLEGTRETVGLPYECLLELASEADLLINVSGMLRDPAILEPIPVRAYLDLDPVFNQMWEAVEGVDTGLGGHTAFVTVGQAIGRPECPVPTCGRTWLRTLPPVVLRCWPPGRRLNHDGLTTVANWRGYGSIHHQGVLYGQKAHSLRGLMSLPTRTAERFLLALAIHPDERDDLEALASNGWRIMDPHRWAGTPGQYRRFVRGSKAEFGLAKSGYVAARSGWFSDRSACYLASGRPVIAHHTGFADFLPTGAGLFAFETADDVLGAIDDLNAGYDWHRRQARAIAEAYFDSELVLSRMLDQLGAAS